MRAFSCLGAVLACIIALGVTTESLVLPVVYGPRDHQFSADFPTRPVVETGRSGGATIYEYRGVTENAMLTVTVSTVAIATMPRGRFAYSALSSVSLVKPPDRATSRPSGPTSAGHPIHLREEGNSGVSIGIQCGRPRGLLRTTCTGEKVIAIPPTEVPPTIDGPLIASATTYSASATRALLESVITR